MKKIIYLTYEALFQYKNTKKFDNIYHHEEDFSVKCEWHLIAIAHGKTVFDGICGIV